MTDWTGTLVIGLLIMSLVVMAKTCGLRGHRNLRRDQPPTPRDPAMSSRDVTSGFRDPYR